MMRGPCLRLEQHHDRRTNLRDFLQEIRLRWIDFLIDTQQITSLFILQSLDQTLNRYSFDVLGNSRENMPSPLSLPPEILLLILQKLDLLWLCRARLVCIAFADAGSRCLVYTVKVARCPASFERVKFITNHPVLKFYVKTLVYAYDPITINRSSLERKTAQERALIQQEIQDLETFNSSNQDIASFKELIQSFPNLQQISLESPFITHDQPLAAAYLRLNSRSQPVVYEVLESSITDLSSAIGAIDAIRDLRIEEAAVSIIHIDPPRCFEKLARLRLSFREEFIDLNGVIRITETVPRMFDHPFPCLTYLHIGFEPYLHNESLFPLSFPLPSTLQTLELYCVQFPRTLRLPSHLKRLVLSFCKLMDSDRTHWINFIDSCRMECQFDGFLMAEDPDPMSDYGTWCNCGDILLGTEVRSLLAEICSPLFPDDLRLQLLKVIFDPSLIRPANDRTMKIYVSEHLAERYRQFKNHIKR